MKYFLTLIFTLFTFNCYGSVEIDLANNLEDRSFEVSNTRGEFVDITLQYQGLQLPIVEVIGQYAGFECSIKAIKRQRSIRMPNNTLVGHYLILVEWSPGADSSGCEVEIKNPYTSHRAVVSLYMAY